MIKTTNWKKNTMFFYSVIQFVKSFTRFFFFLYLFDGAQQYQVHTTQTEQNVLIKSNQFNSLTMYEVMYASNVLEHNNTHRLNEQWWLFVCVCFSIVQFILWLFRVRECMRNREKKRKDDNWFLYFAVVVYILMKKVTMMWWPHISCYKHTYSNNIQFFFLWKHFVICLKLARLFIESLSAWISVLFVTWQWFWWPG